MSAMDQIFRLENQASGSRAFLKWEMSPEFFIRAKSEWATRQRRLAESERTNGFAEVAAVLFQQADDAEALQWSNGDVRICGIPVYVLDGLGPEEVRLVPLTIKDDIRYM